MLRIPEATLNFYRKSRRDARAYTDRQQKLDKKLHQIGISAHAYNQIGKSAKPYQR